VSRLLLALLAIAWLLSSCGTPGPRFTAGASTPAASPSPASAATVERTLPSATVGPALTPPAQTNLSGSISIDGSSTVFPITEGAIHAFRSFAPDVAIRLGVSGTGAGFEKFCRGETRISGASRPIKNSEADLCAANQIAFVELPIAYDGISVVVNPANSWAECVTLDELRRVWAPAAQGQVSTWRDMRPDWPDSPINLYGAGQDSGTYDYFTAAVVGEEGVSRTDFTGSEDDYLIAQDLAADPQGLAFFGYFYYLEHREQLRALAIDGGAGCVAPSDQTIADGSYQPLARPIFLYVRADALDQPATRAFVEFYLANGPALVRRARYIPLPTTAYELVAARAARRVTGSVFAGGSQIGVSLETLLALEESTP
jgi:phosphate transport system substrate-binding protein